MIWLLAGIVAFALSAGLTLFFWLLRRPGAAPKWDEVEPPSHPACRCKVVAFPTGGPVVEAKPPAPSYDLSKASGGTFSPFEPSDFVDPTRATHAEIDRDLLLYGNCFVQILHNEDGTERDRVRIPPVDVLWYGASTPRVPYGLPRWVGNEAVMQSLRALDEAARRGERPMPEIVPACDGEHAEPPCASPTCWCKDPPAPKGG